MSNTSSSMTNASPTSEDDYAWPVNLRDEVRDMADAAFLIYTQGYILHVARNKGVDGIEFDEDGRVTTKDTHNKTNARTMGRSFTPSEVLRIVKDNRERLKESFSFFEDTTMLEQSLGGMQVRARSPNEVRPLTLLEYDDKFQTSEMVYAVAKDDVNKRITLVFRGTDNDLALLNNWSSNVSIRQKRVALPSTGVFQVNLPRVNNLRLHSGFYKYIFGETKSTEDEEGTRKYDQILGDIKPLLQKNPDYKLYVTGHSLGGALAGMASFFLTCEEDIPKPVTCIAFAAPRFGDYNYLQAVQVLEKKGLLRYCRVVNENDTVACIPSSYRPFTDYRHGGFQVRLPKGTRSDPELTYPRLKDSILNRFKRTWGNSHFSMFNLTFDHSDYRERVDTHSEWLTGTSLNEMYRDSDLTGFELE